MRKWIFPVILAVFLAVAASAIWYALRPSPRRAVFLIVVDTLRADRLSSYGYAANSTVNISSLADRGVLFENAQANASWTVPSMGSLMTSLYPGELGLVEKPAAPGEQFEWNERREQIRYTLTLSTTTLAEVFTNNGFHTAGFVNQPALNNRDGFVQGFDDWFYPAGSDSVIRRNPRVPLLDDALTRKRTTLWDDVDRTDSALVGSFEKWLSSAPTEDLFVWVHLLSPHKPYAPPPEFATGRRAASTRGLDVNSDNYDGEVRYTDHLVGRLLRAIDAHVGLNHSIVILTSDHGEEFGEHGMADHGHSLHREVVHVPLIISAPGLPGGKRVDSPVRLIDVFPTILSLCELSGPESADIRGIDLVPLTRGQVSGLDVFAEGMLYGSTERAVQAGDFRLMWDEEYDDYRLFRPSTDAGETEDVSQRYGEESRMLRELLDHYHIKIAERYTEHTRGYSSADSLEAAKERERVLKAMKSLGYVGD